MKLRNSIGLPVIMVLMISGCSLPNESSKTASTKEARQSINAEAQTIDDLVEDRKVYDNDKADSIINLYVTVLSEPGQGTFHTMNHWYDTGENQGDPPKLSAIVQEGSPDGPQKDSWGYGTDAANSSIEIRGNTSRLVPQKSYQIKLAKSAGLWHGQTSIDLNKHYGDLTRVRQKLSFDMFKEIPNITSLRTQFVHLHVKDLTVDTPDKQFIDYGLFTHVEQPNKRFLYNHGLDPNAHLYKATLFEFFRYPEQLKLATDPKYNKKEFDKVLQIKGSEDHEKLIKMLDAVNDYKQNINNVIEKYFNRENYLTWLASNLLMANIDTDAQNFYLYSPLNSNKFYFLPWDYDAAWGQQAEETEIHPGFTAKWQLGISNYWGSVLHRRFLKDPKNLEDLGKKVEEVAKILNKEKIKELTDKYLPIANQYVKNPPDLNWLPYKVENFGKSYESLVNIPEQNKDTYYKSLENPMPIYLDDPKFENGAYSFAWDSSYDFQGDDLTYDFQVSQSIDFSSVYVEQKGLTITSAKVPQNQLRTGKNYWRVIVKDSKGHTQIAFDRLKGDDNIWYNGQKEFITK
ncbi:CotH kinase family protein [Bacillus paramycoides]|uniref:CotH kinase family protein n=1 Tax=Bacillus paramycoides TaxID=2026194 RepID=A0ABU6N0L7_9BACI|nr:CotH kinase family protein [Bacillus paramycoides]